MAVGYEHQDLFGQLLRMIQIATQSDTLAAISTLTESRLNVESLS